MKRPAYKYAIHEVVNVHDGDTFTFIIDLGFRTFVKANIRLKDYNCPEMPSAAGKAAQKFSAQAIKDAEWLLVVTIKDSLSFERWVADVYVDGEHLGERLVAAGHAERV